MAQADRVVGNVGELQLTPSGGSATYHGASIKNVTLEVEIATRDNAAVNDVWSYPKELRRSARLTWTCAAESGDTLGFLLKTVMGAVTLGVTDLIGFIWTPYCAVADYASDQSAKLPRLTGTLIITRCSQNGDEEGSRSFEALVQGAVTATVA